MFAEKVKNAEFCGAIGALIIDNQPNTRFTKFYKIHTYHIVRHKWRRHGHFLNGW